MNSHAPDRIAQEVEEAYAAHGASLFRFAVRVCGCRDDAEDVVVETFAHAYRRWNDIRETGSRRAWLFGIAANRARMTRRRSRPTEILSDEMPHRENYPMELIALEQEIIHLPLKQREAFLLMKGEGLSAREAANALGRPVGTILYDVHRAVCRLRCVLEGPPLAWSQNHEL